MPPVLTVEPIAGLGNRLRVIASSVELSKLLGCGLRIVWTRTTDLNSRLGDLFEPSPHFSVVESSWTVSRLRRRVLRPFLHDAYFDDRTVDSLGSPERAVACLKGRARPFVITCLRFLPAVLRREDLSPTSDIQCAVDEIARGFSPSIVGVHVRRADQGLSIAESPTSAFLEAMRRAIKEDSKTTFFLATDSPDDAGVISSAFPGRVTRLRPDLSRPRPAAARDALIDMECLGRCRYVLGSYASSFSDVAAERGGVPLTVVRAIPAKGTSR